MERPDSWYENQGEQGNRGQDGTADANGLLNTNRLGKVAEDQWSNWTDADEKNPRAYRPPSHLIRYIFLEQHDLHRVKYGLSDARAYENRDEHQKYTGLRKANNEQAEHQHGYQENPTFAPQVARRSQPYRPNHASKSNRAAHNTQSAGADSQHLIIGENRQH